MSVLFESDSHTEAKYFKCIDKEVLIFHSTAGSWKIIYGININFVRS